MISLMMTGLTREVCDWEAELVCPLGFDRNRQGAGYDTMTLK